MYGKWNNKNAENEYNREYKIIIGNAYPTKKLFIQFHHWGNRIRYYDIIGHKCRKKHLQE